MKKVLIIGLGGQGEKYINYFLKNNFVVSGVCNTDITKNNIEKKYNIGVFLSTEKMNYKEFDFIIIALPLNIQGQKALEISSLTNSRIIVEIPVTFDLNLLKKLSKKENIEFFLEENYTLLSKFLKKIDVNNITKFNIDLIVDKLDLDNIDAMKVAYTHLFNNFLFDLDFTKLDINIKNHNSENIYYKIDFLYNNLKIEYYFGNEKYLKIGDKLYYDNYNFDFVLENIITFKLDKKYYLRNCDYVGKIYKR